MILTDFYKFQRTATKAKYRMDCVASTHSYPQFEEKAATKERRATDKRDAVNVGDIVVSYMDCHDNMNAMAHRRASKVLSLKGSNVSSIFVPDVERNDMAYGDFVGTGDALLFVFHNMSVIDGVIQPNSIMEVFVARGKAQDCIPLYEMLSDGELEDELEELRKKATPNPIQNIN